MMQYVNITIIINKKQSEVNMKTKQLKLKPFTKIETYASVKSHWDKLNEDGSVTFINYNDNMINCEVERRNKIVNEPNTKQSEGKTMNTKDLSMSQRDKLKSALNSINWSNGRGSIVGIGYTESEVGYFFRKFQYGNDKIKYRIEERVNGIFAHCLNRTKKI